MNFPPQPTFEQISAHDKITWGDKVGYAAWYPQMGGYVSVCVIRPHENGCFDVYIWHDGSFPFSDDGEPGHNPVMLHHCVAEQFIDFGKFAESLTIERDPNG